MSYIIRLMMVIHLEMSMKAAVIQNKHLLGSARQIRYYVVIFGFGVNLNRISRILDGSVVMCILLVISIHFLAFSDLLYKYDA